MSNDTAGSHMISVSRDSFEKEPPAGIYFYSFKINNRKITKNYNNEIGAEMRKFRILGLMLIFGIMSTSVKTDSLRDTLWRKVFSFCGAAHPNEPRYSYVEQTTDSGYIVVGNDGWNAYLIKAYSTTGIEEQQEKRGVRSSRLSVYPNPFVQRTILSYQIPIKSKVSLRIYDISGRCVKILVDKDKESGYYKEVLDSKELSSGIYFAKFVCGDYKEVKKLILLD